MVRNEFRVGCYQHATHLSLEVAKGVSDLSRLVLFLIQPCLQRYCHGIILGLSYAIEKRVAATCGPLKCTTTIAMRGSCRCVVCEQLLISDYAHEPPICSRRLVVAASAFH